jgi:hypothetical protein
MIKDIITRYDLNNFPQHLFSGLHQPPGGIFPTSVCSRPKRFQRSIPMPDRVRDACESSFEAHQGDCSGFAHAVATQLNVTLVGVADQIVETLRTDPAWTRIADGVAAAQRAKAGKLVIAGLKGSEQTRPDPHGHVVVVVDGPMAHNAYPSAYWGSLGGQPGRNQTLNFAWTVADRDRITYAEHNL